jgi:hypothetical protein
MRESRKDESCCHEAEDLSSFAKTGDVQEGRGKSRK